MATKENQPFITELRGMTSIEVRENTTPSIQPEPAKRAMATTELERRRQERAPDSIKDPMIGPGVFLLLLTLAIAIAIAAYWMFS